MYFSIRNRVLILGAVASGSIWAGALFQFQSLRHESERLEHVSDGLDASRIYSEVTQAAVRERGLTNGWLHRSDAKPSELNAIRSALDQKLLALTASNHYAATRPLPTVLGDLSHQRALVDQRSLDPRSTFFWYSNLIATLQDNTASIIASGMVDVGLPYEHVNHLHRAEEQLAQIRGISNGALQGGQLTDDDRTELIRLLTLFTEFQHLYLESAPASSIKANAASLSTPSVLETLDRVNRLIWSRDISALQAPGGWWELASSAVDTLDKSALTDSETLTALASKHIRDVVLQMRLTMGALVILGILTLAFVLATAGRVMRGLDSLLDGIENATTRRNFTTRVDETRRDEFGVISAGVNRLIAIASIVVDEHEQRSQTDALTGLLNRRGIDLQLSIEIEEVRSKSQPLSVMMIDIDHFKRVNDEFGHLAGDRVIAGTAALIRESLRSEDSAGRYGGEEFLVVLANCTKEFAGQIAEKIRSIIEMQDFELPMPTTVSVGYAEWNGESRIIDLIGRADRALYRSKAEGRNRVFCDLE